MERINGYVDINGLKAEIVGGGGFISLNVYVPPPSSHTTVSIQLIYKKLWKRKWKDAVTNVTNEKNYLTQITQRVYVRTWDC